MRKLNFLSPNVVKLQHKQVLVREVRSPRMNEIPTHSESQNMQLSYMGAFLVSTRCVLTLSRLLTHPHTHTPTPLTHLASDTRPEGSGALYLLLCRLIT